MKDPQKFKDLVTIHVIDLIDNGKAEDREAAIENLKLFAKFFTVPLKDKSINSDLKESLRAFILNQRGYMVTILNLYNSLSKYATKQKTN